MKSAAFLVPLTLVCGVSCVSGIYGEAGDYKEPPYGKRRSAMPATTLQPPPAAAALPHMSKIKDYFQNRDKSGPQISNLMTRVGQQYRRPRLQWRRGQRMPAHAGQRTLGVQPARRSSYSVQPARRSSYGVQPARRSSYGVQPARKSSYGVQPARRSSYVRNDPSLRRPYPNRRIRYSGQNLAPNNQNSPSAAYDQRSGDRAGVPLDQSGSESDAGNDKRIRVHVNAQKPTRPNNRRWIRIRPQLVYPMAYQSRWIPASQNSPARGDPSSEALAMLTQRLSKMEASLARLKESILLQGAVHLKTTEKMEAMLKAQAVEASENMKETQAILLALKQRCACPGQRKGEALGGYDRVTESPYSPVKYKHDVTSQPSDIKGNGDGNGNDEETPKRKEVWNGLSVTFGINPFDPNVFAGLPRTVQDATAHGWTKIADCDSNSKFRGIRYVKDNDYAVVLLFDVNGYIAGIQCGIAKSGLPSNYPPAKQRGNIFQDDGDHFTLTAYFVDPANICNGGRTASQFSLQGTGTGLYIQNGSNPVTQSIHIPSVQPALAGTGWTLGHCFPAMGIHYWYSVATDMNCDDFQPVFLLYNEKQLTAFGWALGVNQSSKRFEHPPFATVSAFMNPVPQCLANYAHLSTMHIYMTAHPSQDLC